MSDFDDSRAWRGRFLIIAAAVFWSTSGFFAKAPIFSDWPLESRGFMLAAWRALFAAALLVFFIKEVRWSWRLLPMMTFFTAMNWTFLNAMVCCEPTLAIWLQYTAPAWVFLLSWLLSGESPIRRDWPMLVFAGCGVALILLATQRESDSWGLVYGLLSGLFFALVLLTLRWNRNFDAAWLVFLNNAATALAFAPLVWAAGILPQGSQWPYLLGFGGLQFALPYIIFARGVRHISSHEASGLVLLEPILVPLWVFLAWRHSPDYSPPELSTVAGAGLILLGLLLRYLPTPNYRALPS
jgi:DME family drug/metabolite transporter